ncbi:MAG: hypothetical protein IPP57_14625 [Candidatus Obscuribacter sp.]|jgi:hypothetical protein|nr:hypothetical protein [Candidatus Obscuribacter sp.]MBP6350719.1 hypothetical protein [Candidatus Obscuribacter sp.]MBP6593239.1 hypothetical protein [Candidatus Obscuribacter sp.]
MKHQNTDSNQGKPERVGDNHDGTKFNQTEDASARLRLAAFERPTTSTRDNARQLEAQNLVIADQRTSLSDAQKQAQIGRLSGNPAGAQVGRSMELNALIHALNHSPTPEGLGKEGCMASISRYAILPALKERGINMPHFIDSHQFLAYIKKHPELADITTQSQRNLQVTDLQPGDVIIGQKSTGNHVMMVTRVPESWQYPPGALMFTGNTGLKMADGPAYPHFRAAQEVIGPGTDRYNYHHGQLNSQMSTNPYLGGRFQIIRFRDNQK